MLKFNSSQDAFKFSKLQNHVGVYQTYLDEVLLPAVKEGNWDELECMTVIRLPNGGVINFIDDVWDLSSLNTEDAGKIYFTYTESQHDNKRGRGTKLERNLCNQIKCYALCLMFADESERGFHNTAMYIRSAISLAKIMLAHSVNDFSMLDEDRLSDWAQEYELLQSNKSLSTLNIMMSLTGALPFTIDFGETHTLSPNKLGVKPSSVEQYVVIPPRIYSALMRQYSEDIKALVPHIKDIETSLEVVFQLEERLFNNKTERLRYGKTTLNKVLLKTSVERTTELFEQHGVEVSDYGKNDQWLTLFKKSNPAFKESANYFKNWLKAGDLKIGKIQFESVGGFKDYLQQIDAKCKALCLALSGMRVDELYRVSHIYGAQILTVQGQKIHLFTTRQSKITAGQQTKDDIFVTTPTGYKAFKVLSTIHTQYRKRFTSERNRMFAALQYTQNPCNIQKKSVVSGIIEFLNGSNCSLDLKLTTEDMKYLNISDPGQSKFEQEGLFRITNHMFRRSLAYYLIGYELLSFPQLKDQLSHLSPAMTRWYANNASSFQKFYKEINRERTRQQSDILARIYQRIANRERISGGKAKALQAIAGDGKSYFEKEENREKLFPRYWKKLIENDDAHLHAIAPGMYCTNKNCSMRINIELAECLGCETSIIEEVAYAEQTRIKAMRDLLYLEETGELNHSGFSFYAMKIKSSERIMSELGFEYEPFKFPENFMDSQLVVSTTK